MSQVPAATRALRVLRFLASQPDPVPLDRIMRACDCLLYTSDAADDMQCVYIGGRRIIKKKFF